MSRGGGSTALEIVEAKPGDAVEIARLNCFVQALHVERAPAIFRASRDEAAATAYFELALAENPSIAILLARLAGQPCGYAMLEEIHRPATLFKHGRDALMIDQIAVDPDHRRRGVGRALVEAALVQATRRALGEVMLDHWAFNDEASAFFAALGFMPSRIFLSRAVSEESR